MKKGIVAVSAVIALVFCLVFSGSAFSAEPADIATAEVVTAYESYTYTGAEIQPKVKVTLSVTDELGKTKTVKLVRDTDYTVSYSNNKNVGKATITVKGIGAYKGAATGSFNITARDINNKKFDAYVASPVKVGKTPSLTVTYNGAALVKDTDYTVTVSNTDKAGYKTGKAKLKGIGNFSGKLTLNFSVYPTMVRGIKAKNVKQNSLTLTWNSKKSEGVTGYKVYRADNKSGKNAKLIKTVKSNSASLDDVDSSTKYNFFVVAYKTNNGKTVKGDMSNACITCTKPKKPQLNYVVKKEGNKIYVNWNGVYNPSGYEIKYSLDRSLKTGVEVVRAKASKSSKTIKVPDNGYAYFVKVRAYKKYSKNGKTKTVYGPWSVKMSSIFGRVYKQYTTNYPYNPNRTTNLKLACKAINGTIVNPGETFSFNATVGKRTAAKGYKPATIFTGPNSHQPGIGGGVCQVASTMFNAALLANYQIVERHQHSQKVTYCPVGRDAAIFWGSEDFKFKNNTDYPIKIRMYCEGGKLTCQYAVSYKIKAPKVNLSVTRSGKHYTLKRTVNGNVNYTTSSTY